MLFFKDGTHSIDYVLVWRTKEKDVKVAEERDVKAAEKRAATRKVFEKNLRDAGLLLEDDYQVDPGQSGGIPGAAEASQAQWGHPGHNVGIPAQQGYRGHRGGIPDTVETSRAQQGYPGHSGCIPSTMEASRAKWEHPGHSGSIPGTVGESRNACYTVTTVLVSSGEHIPGRFL